MRFEFRHILEIVGVAAVVLSLIFVGYELRLARSAALSDGFNEETELARSLHEFIAGNADIWARGCLAEELTPTEAVVFTNIVYALIHYQFTRYERRGLAISTAPARVPARALAFNRYNFEGFNEIWETDRLSGPRVFRDAVEREYDLLVNSGVAKNTNVAMCGR